MTTTRAKMHPRVAIVLALLAVPTTLAAKPLAVGDTCSLQKPLVWSSKAGGKGQKIKVGQNATVVLVEIKGAWVKAKQGDKVGFAKKTDLEKLCKKVVAAASSPASPAPAPTPPVAPPPGPAAPPPGTATPSSAAATPTKIASASAFGDSEKTKIAVMDLEGTSGIPPDLLTTLAKAVAATLADLGPFSAISGQDIRQMSAFASMQQSLGCNTTSCLAEIGGALGADDVLAGSLSQVGDTYLLQMQLMSIRDARVVSRVTRDYKGTSSGLIEEARAACKLLVRDLSAGKSGTLLVKVSEEGATIRIDGVIAGVSPAAIFELAGGLHPITVEKEGFVRIQQDVMIKGNEPALLDLQMIPSADFQRSYQSNVRGQRIRAWSLLGAGIAGALASGVVYFVSTSRADSLRHAIKDYNRKGFRDSAEYDSLVNREKSLASLNLITALTGGVGALGLGIGGILVYTVDDPHRFVATALP